MKFALLAALTLAAPAAFAEYGESAHRAEVLAVAAGAYDAAVLGHHNATYLVRTPAGCSNAGDQTARPVYATKKNGKVVLVGYECIQDNRGGGNGG